MWSVQTRSLLFRHLFVWIPSLLIFSLTLWHGQHLVDKAVKVAVQYPQTKCLVIAVNAVRVSDGRSVSTVYRADIRYNVTIYDADVNHGTNPAIVQANETLDFYVNDKKVDSTNSVISEAI